MEPKKNKPSQPHHLETEFRARLVKIEEQIKNLDAEKKEHINIFNKRKELLILSRKKLGELLKEYEDRMRKHVYFYDYLPLLLSGLQIAFSFKKEEITRDLSEIERSIDNFKKKFYHEFLELDIRVKNLSNEEKLDQTEKALLNEKKQILLKLNEIPIHPSSFFKPSVSTSNEVEKNSGCARVEGNVSRKSMVI